MMKRSNSFALTGLCLLMLSCGSQPTTSSPADFIDGVATALQNGGKVDLTAFEWTREPAAFSIDGQTLTVTTAPHTDLWQRTYYHFRNDNAPVFQIQTKEQYFSFVVKTDFTQSHQRFDQCGVVMQYGVESFFRSCRDSGVSGVIIPDLPFKDYMEEVRLKHPRMIGFGISNKQTLEVAQANAAGAIIGSKFVTLLEQSASPDEALDKLFAALGK